MTLQITSNSIKSKTKIKGKKGKNNNNNSYFDSTSATQIIVNNNTLDKLKYLHQSYGYPLQSSYSEIIEMMLQCLDTEKFRELNNLISTNDDE